MCWASQRGRCGLKSSRGGHLLLGTKVPSAKRLRLPGGDSLFKLSEKPSIGLLWAGMGWLCRGSVLQLWIYPGIQSRERKEEAKPHPTHCGRTGSHRSPSVGSAQTLPEISRGSTGSPGLPTSGLCLPLSACLCSGGPTPAGPQEPRTQGHQSRAVNSLLSSPFRVLIVGERLRTASDCCASKRTSETSLVAPHLDWRLVPNTHTYTHTHTSHTPSQQLLPSLPSFPLGSLHLLCPRTHLQTFAHTVAFPKYSPYAFLSTIYILTSHTCCTKPRPSGKPEGHLASAGRWARTMGSGNSAWCLEYPWGLGLKCAPGVPYAGPHQMRGRGTPRAGSDSTLWL